MPLLRGLLDKVLRSASPRHRDGSSPGQAGRHATTTAHRVGRVRTTYSPNADGDPDPGEIVWTWVPYEENDGRGKDRPVLIVAAEPSGTLLAVQLSSRDHSEWVPIGAGTWDNERRSSWADTGRLLRVHPRGMRREATALDRNHFDAVITALNERHHWR